MEEGMKQTEIIAQLRSLRESQAEFAKTNGDEIYKRDVEALDAAIEALERIRWRKVGDRPPEDGVDAASRTAEKEKMMAEYIERQAVIDLLKGAGEESGSPVVDIELMIEAVQDDISAADAAPIIHAKWEMRRVYVNGCEGSGEEKAFCSHCNKSNKQYTPPYCPHCGAKMDEEDENNGTHQ